MEKPTFDPFSPGHGDEHTAPTREHLAASPPASWHDKGHMDENTHGSAAQSPHQMPAAQSTGKGAGEEASQIRDEVAGHASHEEYQQLKGIHPRSLGERAKMDALKSKYEPAGSGKNG